MTTTTTTTSTTSITTTTSSSSSSTVNNNNNNNFSISFSSSNRIIFLVVVVVVVVSVPVAEQIDNIFCVDLLRISLCFSSVTLLNVAGWLLNWFLKGLPSNKSKLN
jgi:hypothetical protein